MPHITAANYNPTLTAVEQGNTARSITQLKWPMAVKVHEGDAIIFIVEPQPGPKYLKTHDNSLVR
ncbi:MAG: hypothetical protein ABIN01_13400 [Ferruginibacter sp.]